jgi:D-serine deaminase-like pyridoxal phosphate-dependent protein
MDQSYRIANETDLPSPSLVFYEDRIARNLDKSLVIAGSPHRLRPHVKTHKTREIVALALGRGVRRFKCATIAEAEMVAQCGADDVMLAYPLVGPNIGRFLRLVERFPRTRLSAIADEPGPVRTLSEAASERGLRIELLLDLDTGLHRTGVPVGKEAFELYELISASKGLVARGLHVYDGQNHQSDLGERTKAAAACHAAALELRDDLLARGHSVETIVMGGTPTFPCYAGYPEVELSPGTCFLQDAGYASSFPDLDFEAAALLFSRVISVNRQASSFCTDLGYKAIASDPKGSRGKVWNIEGAEALLQNEEHWVFRAPILPEVGMPVYVQPTHICPTSALHAKVFVVNGGGRWYSEWKVVARDRFLEV